MTACLSDLRLDELLAGELAGDAAAAAADHVAGCERCRAREHALAGDRDRFRAALPSIARRRAGRWIGIAGAGVAAAAAVILVATLPRHDTDGTRSKGGAHLGFVVEHGGAMRAMRAMRIGATGEVVHPGDTLTYLVTMRAPGYVTVFGRDAAGRVAIYVPTARVAAGRDVELPIATRLDATLGREEIAAVFCAEALAVASADDPPAGCTVDRLAIEKAP
jgi:Domain of unknown function (DUF4384)